jgi:hypothetical protein
MPLKELAAPICLAVALYLAPAAAVAQTASDAVVGTPETIRDFMIQNVCLDGGGAVVSGLAPISGDPRCVGQRDLRPGEPLPYHKHDHPSPGDGADASSGYQRHDSFPVDTAGLGVVIEHSFDFGFGEGRRFGNFDSPSDGGDIALLSPPSVTPGTVSFGATEDGGSGFLFWVGECSGTLTGPALAHSWLIAEFDPARPMPLRGETVARLGRAKLGERACPARFNGAWTQWSVRPFRYRAAPGQGAVVELTTLVSEHYDNARRDAADQVERFYFTRELGGIRWESWGNRNGNRQYSAAFVAEQAARFAASGRCSTAEPPQGGPPMVLLDCREWTRIVPVTSATGDPPGFFIEAIRRRPGAPDFLGVPTGQK